MLAIAVALQERGFSPVVSVGQPYVEVVQRRGLTAVSIMDRQQFQQFLDRPGLWTTWGSRMLLAEAIPNCLRAHWDVLQRHYRPGNTVLVAHPLDLASRVFRDCNPQVPLASVHLAPATLRTPREPPKLTAWPLEPRRPVALMKALYWLADLAVLGPIVSKPLNQFRHQLGLPAIRRPLNHWWYSPDLLLAMFPEWFGPRARVLPSQTRCVGFALDDGPVDATQEETLNMIRQRLRTAKTPATPAHAPLVITAGTAHRQARRFFRLAIDAAVDLDWPTILVSPQPDQIPTDLPPHFIASQYVSLSALLPEAGGIVHHGGVGTTAVALASGCPQLIIPRAFDQFDNSRRVSRLSCGLQIRQAHLTRKTLRHGLTRLKEDPEITRAARTIATRFRSDRHPPVTAAMQAAEAIAKLFQNRVKAS